MNIARARMHVNKRPTTVNGAADEAPRFLDPALNRHGDRGIDDNGAGGRACFQVESSLWGQPQSDIPRSGPDFPISRLRTFDGDIAAAGIGAQPAADSIYLDVARAGMSVHFAVGFFFQANISAARLRGNGAGDAASFDITRTSMHLDVSCQVGKPQVAGTALQIQVGAQILDGLVSRIAAGAHPSIRRNRDFVVNRNIPQVHVIDPNTPSRLANGRILFQFLDLGLLAAMPPGLAHVDFSGDRNRARRPTAHDDIARAGENLQIGVAVYLKRALECSLDRRGVGQANRQKDDEGYYAEFPG